MKTEINLLQALLELDPSYKIKRPAHRLQAAVKVLLILFLGMGAAGAIVLASFIITAPPLDPDYPVLAETSFVLDSEDRLVASLHGEENRTCIKLEEIPRHVIQAFIATEDRHFYEHWGVDIPGNIRALLANIKKREIRQGASTITQQLVRSLYLPQERTWKRKVQEIWLALQLERAWSKNTILELYLNQIYFGRGAYGLEAAAQTYFGKPAAALNTREGAMLAGLVCAPNRLNPFQDLQAAEQRTATVLSVMKECGYLEEAEYRRWLNCPLEYAEKQDRRPWGYFLDYLIHWELRRILGAMPEYDSPEKVYRAIYTGGLRIYTTLDPALQKHAEETLNNPSLYPETLYLDMEKLKAALRRRSFNAGHLEPFIDPVKGIPQPQAALVMADPATGALLCLVGGREYRPRENELLRFLSLRQPGSALKPLVVYAPAFQEGLLAGAGSLLQDTPLTVDGWSPRNYDGRFRGRVTVRQALSLSLNLPAVRVLQRLTPRRGAAYAERMGITSLTAVDKRILSTALGGITHGVSLLEMTQAYAVLANGGIKKPLYAVRSIEDRNGRGIYRHKSAAERILSPQAAFLVNHILQDVARYTTAAGLYPDRPLAAKTGTSEQGRDACLVAYTPNLVASLWMGYDEPVLGGISRGWLYTTRILRQVLAPAFKGLSPQNFERPPGLVSLTICRESGALANEYCREHGTATTDYFLAESRPTAYCALHREPPPPESHEPEGEAQPLERPSGGRRSRRRGPG